MDEMKIILDNRRFIKIGLVSSIVAGLMIGIFVTFITYLGRYSCTYSEILFFILLPIVFLFLLMLVVLGAIVGFEEIYEIRFKNDKLSMTHIKKNYTKEYPPFHQLEKVYYNHNAIIRRGIIILSPTIEYFVPGVPQKGNEDKLDEFIELVNKKIKSAIIMSTAAEKSPKTANEDSSP